ncbi:hypothetical protein U9M48_041308 [Paspalum notatum var. saurae]|uniref:PHD-type domain-containing protein n=1 Tax=Paspalum notatum var. saurae TaxID=547442 RepID=A0AAQ3XF51_PASNO
MMPARQSQRQNIILELEERILLTGKGSGVIPSAATLRSDRPLTLSRDLPDQLEAHAHRLLRDAGWSIRPRIRSDRPKVAYYFTAPERERESGAVRTSLAQAWRLCGQRLLVRDDASGGGSSEPGRLIPGEWSDVERFWKDLVDAMDSVGRMTPATLLRRWQLLDPFVAVVFIDKRISALQKQRTVRAVDSSTSIVVDCGGDSRPSSTDDKHSPTTPCSGYSQVAAEICNGYANIGNRLVKRVRKKSRWLSDFDSTGLNGLYARSFTKPLMALSESASCSAGSSSSTPKQHMNEPAKPCGEKSSMPLVCERINGTHGKQSTEELTESNGCSVIKSTVTESDADKNVSAEKQLSRLLKKSPLRCLSKETVTSSIRRNAVVKLCHKLDATMVECSSSLEAQSHKEPAITSKSEIFKKQEKKRPFEMNFNDDDLLVTAIVKKRDCQKYASRLVSANAKFRKIKSSKKYSRLLIQTKRKGGTDVLDGRQIILARKTVMCWLIATGFMTLKDVVQCRDPKNNEVLKDGWVTWDGILCSCCIKTLSISDFKAHAKIGLPKSSLNLCLQSGKSLTLCQIEAWNAEYMNRRSNACSRKVEASDENDDTCGFCGDGGELLCCDNCPSTYHQACLSAKELPDDSWYCHNCLCRICDCPISEKEISSFSAILKCLQCGAAHHDTCIEIGATTFEEIEADEWFCGRYCKEIYLGLHGSVGVENSLSDGLSWTILRCNSGGQKLHSLQKISQMVECNAKLAVALTLMEECFARMVDTRTGIDMIPHVLYNQGILTPLMQKTLCSNQIQICTFKLSGLLHYDLGERRRDLMCSVYQGLEIHFYGLCRVHGVKAAELPFIATCREHRRQGMCRRLINTIEEMLRSFHVKMLVLSAIPELVDTWVSVFGFKPIEEDERKQLDTINLVLFPGTSLLTKNLEYGTVTDKSGITNDADDILGLPDGYCIPNGSGSEHFEQVGSDFLELGKGNQAVPLDANLQHGTLLLDIWESLDFVYYMFPKCCCMGSCFQISYHKSTMVPMHVPDELNAEQAVLRFGCKQEGGSPAQFLQGDLDASDQ